MRSYWQTTLKYDAKYPLLSSDLQVDVAVIGGGYSGMSAVEHLSEKGVSAVLLEANTIGWGASGRNGGVVSSKFRKSFSNIARQFGLEDSRMLHQIALASVEYVQNLIEKYNIESANFKQNGSLLCAHNTRYFDIACKEAEWLQNQLGDTHITLLDRQQIVEETGSEGFVGGVLFQNQASLHPLNFICGLAAAVQDRYPETIFCETAVTALQKEVDGVILNTLNGSRVYAKRVIIATNAYSNITSASRILNRSIIPFRSSIIATAPIPKELQNKILKYDRTYSETRRMMRWFRKYDNRLLFGGRGAFGGEDSEATFTRLQQAMAQLFPELAKVPIEYKWSGLVAMTLQQMPYVGFVDEQIVVAAGYNGAGVAMSSMLGRFAAEFAMGNVPDVSLLDALNMKSVPFYQLSGLGVRAVVGWYELLDSFGF